MVKEKRNKYIISYALLIIAIILVVISFFPTLSNKPLDTVEFPIEFTVVEHGGGFDVNTTALTFSLIAPGNAAERPVSLDNNYDFPIEVRVLVSENIVDVVNVSSSTVVNPGENITIPVRIEVPQSYLPGKYSGKIRFEMYKF